jgi:hypothetical protein
MCATLTALQDYNITLTARYEGSSAATSDSVTLTALGSPLSAQLTGPSGTVHSTKGNLTFDARGSSDPDDPQNAVSEMSYLWSCQNAVDLSPCFGSQVDGVWSIDPSKVGTLVTLKSSFTELGLHATYGR